MQGWRGEGRPVSDSHDHGGEDRVVCDPDGGSGVRVIDPVTDIQESPGKGVAELLAVPGTAPVNFLMDARDPYHGPHERLVPLEEIDHLADRLGDHLVRGKVTPLLVVGEHGRRAVHARDAVFVYRKEQRFLAVNPRVQKARHYLRALAYGGDREGLVATLLKQGHAGVEHPLPALPGTPLLRRPDFGQLERSCVSLGR